MNAPAMAPGARPRRVLIVEWPAGSRAAARRIARVLEARGARRIASGVYGVAADPATAGWVARLARVVEARGGRLVVVDVAVVADA